METIEEFLAESGASRRSVEIYRQNLRVLERRLKVPLAKASKNALGRLKNELREERSGPYRARLLRMFYRAIGQPDLADFMKMKQRLRRLEPSEILDLNDINQMMHCAASARDKAIISVLWETGCRNSELCSLRIRDVQEYVLKQDGKILYNVFFGKVKGGDAVHEYLLIEAVEHLRIWLDAYRPASQDVPLFINAWGKPMTRDALEKLVKRTAKRSGITKRVHPHAFRHARATFLLIAGYKPSIIKRMLGWKPNSPLLDSTYGHLTDRDTRKEILEKHGMELPEAPKDEGLLQPEGELRPLPAMTRPIPHPDGEVSQPFRGATSSLDVKIADIERKVSLLFDFFGKEFELAKALTKTDQGASP